MPLRQPVETPDPSQGFRVTRIARLALYQNRTQAVQLTVFTEETLPVEVAGRHIPDPHAFPSSLRRGDGQAAHAVLFDQCRNQTRRFDLFDERPQVGRARRAPLRCPDPLLHRREPAVQDT